MVITNSEVFKVKFYFQSSSLPHVEPKDASWGHMILLLSVFQRSTQILALKNISYGLFYMYMYIPICTHVMFHVAGVTSDEHVHTCAHLHIHHNLCHFWWAPCTWLYLSAHVTFFVACATSCGHTCIYLHTISGCVWWSPHFLV